MDSGDQPRPCEPLDCQIMRKSPRHHIVGVGLWARNSLDSGTCLFFSP